MFIQNLRNNEAVSQIVGEIVLLALVITSISVIFSQVLSTPGPQDTTIVTIIGKIEDNQAVFEIQRGEPLGLDTIIIINIAGNINEYSIKDIQNHEWNIGEPISPPTGIIPNGQRVEGTIVDTKTNSIVFWGVLQ